MSEPRTSVVDEGKVLCPFCGSGDTAYAEDVTNEHEIVRVENEVLIFSIDAVADELARNERIICNECGEESAIPDGYVTVAEQ